MIIDSIRIHRVRMPLLCPFRTAYGDGHAIESVLVEMTSGDLAGWGEATPWESPLYSAEWAAGVYILVRDWLAPRIVGHEIKSSGELQQNLAAFKGNTFAKACLDQAWWDLQARLLKTPLWKLLGGASDTVAVGADFGVMENLEALLEAVGHAFKSGYKRVKLKIRPGWDLEIVRAVREAFPKGVFHVDCNSGYRLQNSGLFQALDEFALAMIEQPLAHDDLVDHAKLQRRIRTPICLDESITSLEKAAQAMAIGACRWINLKPGRVGGTTQAVRILRIAEEAGVPCWIGGMLESALGASHCLALATLPNVRYPSDVFPSRRFYEKDLGWPELELSGPSQMRAFQGDGIGCSPEPAQLRALALESCQL